MKRQLALVLLGIVGCLGQVALVVFGEATAVYGAVAVALFCALLVTLEGFGRTFDYPTFFVRNELNYWSGAFGGVVGGGSVFLGSNISRLLSLGFGNEILLLASLVWFGSLVIVLWTGTILRDVEMGYGS